MSNKMNTQEFINYLALQVEEAQVYNTDDPATVLLLFSLADGREVYIEIK